MAGSYTTIWLTAGAVSAAALFRFILNGYRIRARNHKLPGPPHSWLWGSLLAMDEAMKEVPRRVHPQVVASNLRKKFNLPGFFYLDLWPFEFPILAIMDPEVAQQVTVRQSAMKSPTVAVFVDKLAGPGSMVTSDGPEWKRWRSIFNLGFNPKAIIGRTPSIADQGEIWVNKLLKVADSGNAIRLEDTTTCLTIDVIGEVVMGHNFGSQVEKNAFVQALCEQVHLMPNENVSNPIKEYYPWVIVQRMIKQRRNHKIMNDYIGKIVDERFESMQTKEPTAAGILHLPLSGYLDEKRQSTVKSAEDTTSALIKLDPEFRQGIITQIRAFILAGHDTTSSTICYALYLLSKHPACLEKIRLEHENILGPVSKVTKRLQTHYLRLNNLEYTIAVIKETLRLYPPGASLRFGAPDLFIRDPKTGESYPTEGCMLWLNSYGTHRNVDAWGPDVDEFRPERHLGHGMAGGRSVPDGSFRPFEHGPRNCIGQNLAMLEMKIMLGLACRSIEVELALGAEELRDDGSYYAKNGDFRKGKLGDGVEEMYQTLIVTAKPREGMPVRIHRAKWQPQVYVGNFMDD